MLSECLYSPPSPPNKLSFEEQRNLLRPKLRSGPNSLQNAIHDFVKKNAWDFELCKVAKEKNGVMSLTCNIWTRQAERFDFEDKIGLSNKWGDAERELQRIAEKNGWLGSVTCKEDGVIACVFYRKVSASSISPLPAQQRPPSLGKETPPNLQRPAIGHPSSSPEVEQSIQTVEDLLKKLEAYADRQKPPSDREVGVLVDAIQKLKEEEVFDAAIAKFKKDYPPPPDRGSLLDERGNFSTKGALCDILRTELDMLLSAHSEKVDVWRKEAIKAAKDGQVAPQYNEPLLPPASLPKYESELIGRIWKKYEEKHKNNSGSSAGSSPPVSQVASEIPNNKNNSPELTVPGVITNIERNVESWMEKLIEKVTEKISALFLSLSLEKGKIKEEPKKNEKDATKAATPAETGTPQSITRKAPSPQNNVYTPEYQTPDAYRGWLKRKEDEIMSFIEWNKGNGTSLPSATEQELLVTVRKLTGLKQKYWANEQAFKGAGVPEIREALGEARKTLLRAMLLTPPPKSQNKNQPSYSRNKQPSPDSSAGVLLPNKPPKSYVTLPPPAPPPKIMSNK